MTRTCTECHTSKPLREFPISGYRVTGSPTYRKRCKPCHRIFKRATQGRGRRPKATACVECRAPLKADNTREYYSRGRLNRQNRCTSCLNTYMSAAQKRLRKEAGAPGFRARKGRMLEWQHGLTIDDYEKMLLAQGGVCAICRGREEVVHPGTGMPRSLAVDHDHETSKVRGLLCMNCNRALGLFRDDPALLQTAADYLQRNVNNS